MTKLLKIAVEQRINQLKRQINTQNNPMIKQILETEITELNKEFSEIPVKK